MSKKPTAGKKRAKKGSKGPGSNKKRPSTKRERLRKKVVSQRAGRPATKKKRQEPGFGDVGDQGIESGGTD
jgi:hypothetical protein